MSTAASVVYIFCSRILGSLRLAAGRKQRNLEATRTECACGTISDVLLLLRVSSIMFLCALLHFSATAEGDRVLHCGHRV